MGNVEVTSDITDRWAVRGGADSTFAVSWDVDTLRKDLRGHCESAQHIDMKSLLRSRPLKDSRSQNQIWESKSSEQGYQRSEHYPGRQGHPSREAGVVPMLS